MARAARCRNAAGHGKKGKAELYHPKMWMLIKGLTCRSYPEGLKWKTRQLKSITPDKLACFTK